MPPFTCIATSESDTAAVVPTDDSLIFELYVDKPNRFFAQACLQVDDYMGFVQEIGQYHMRISFQESVHLPEEVTITQKLEHTDPKIIHKFLFEYWDQFWTGFNRT